MLHSKRWAAAILLLMSMGCLSAQVLDHNDCGGNGSCTTGAVNATLLGTSMVAVETCGYGSAPTVSFSPAQTVLASAVYGGTNSPMHAVIYYVYAPTAAASLTATCSGEYLSCFIQVLKGPVSSPTVLDVQNGVDLGSCPVQAGLITPHVSGESLLSIACDVTNGVNNFAVDSGLSVVDSVPYQGGTNEPGAVGYLLYGSTGSIDPTWSVTGTGATLDCVGVIAGFLPASSGTCTMGLMGAGAC